MINSNDHPVGWAMLIQELEDAHEHLGKLIGDLANEEGYSEREFRIDLSHVYAHINRGWRRRLMSDDFTAGEWDAAREFPDDLKPIA